MGGAAGGSGSPPPCPRAGGAGNNSSRAGGGVGGETSEGRRGPGLVEAATTLGGLVAAARQGAVRAWAGAKAAGFLPHCRGGLLL